MQTLIIIFGVYCELYNFTMICLYMYYDLYKITYAIQILLTHTLLDVLIKPLTLLMNQTVHIGKFKMNE